MTTSNAMSREELLEFAGLDALGLLDEYESNLYTRAFHNAPPAVQDQVIQLQAQIVSDPSLLPSVDPDPSLRQRVLDAVADAIEQETSHLEPLATIGATARRGQADAAAVAKATFSIHYWRAAAFAMAAGLLIMLYFLTQLSNQNSEITRLVLYSNTEGQLHDLLGPTFKDYLFNPNSKIVSFRNVALTANTNQPRAALVLVEGDGEAFLVIEDLPPSNQQYALQVKDQNGNVEVVEHFQSSGKLGGMRIALDHLTTKLANVTWEISTPNGVWLASI